MAVTIEAAVETPAGDAETKRKEKKVKVKKHKDSKLLLWCCIGSNIAYALVVLVNLIMNNE